MSRYLNVKIPEDFKVKFERLNRDYNMGYSSFPEFIKDCMRRRFEELDKMYNKQK